jgi:hypothetical protein
MPEANDLNLLLLAMKPIDNSIGTMDYFPKIGLMEFWHAPTNLREIRQAFGPADQLEPQPGSCV